MQAGNGESVATTAGDPASTQGEPEFIGAPFRTLVESVTKGACVLFLGAGVHHEPPANSRFTYPEDERPPLASTLARELADRCDFTKVCKDEEPTNLQRVALCYQQQISRENLVEELDKAVGKTKKPSAAVRALAELPFQIVITTNYDQLFERALRRDAVGKDPVVLVYDPNDNRKTADFPNVLTGMDRMSPWLFKMHGDIASRDSIVITDEDYINFVRRMTALGDYYPIPETLQLALKQLPVLFVGYGLLDFNLRLLFRALRWRLDQAERPKCYSVDVRPDPLVKTVWTQELGLSFIVEDVWSFVPRLYREVLGREMPE